MMVKFLFWFFFFLAFPIFIFELQNFQKDMSEFIFYTILPKLCELLNLQTSCSIFIYLSAFWFKDLQYLQTGVTPWVKSIFISIFLYIPQNDHYNNSS